MTINSDNWGAATGSRPRLGWAVVAGQELRDLWLGTRGLTMILAYCVVLSVLMVLIAGNSELNLLDTREAISLFVQVIMGLGTLAALIISADAISGERERGTIEHLLLAPIGRLDLIVGKLIPPLTLWLAAMVIAVPYVLVLAGGTGLAANSFLILLVVGTPVAVALTGFGLAISAVTRTNRASLIIAIVILLALVVPSQLPASALRGPLGEFLIWSNPISAGLRLTGRLLVDQASWGSVWTLLIAPVLAPIFLLAIAGASSRKVGI